MAAAGGASYGTRARRRVGAPAAAAWEEEGLREWRKGGERHGRRRWVDLNLEADEDERGREKKGVVGLGGGLGGEKSYKK
jgi:hypothetical protein